MSVRTWSSPAVLDDLSDAVLEFVVRGIEAEAEEITGCSASVLLDGERGPPSGGRSRGRFPLDATGGVEGELRVKTADASLTRGQRRALSALARRAASAIAAVRGQAEAAAAAYTDPVTGLANRRQLDIDLAAECAAAQRYGRSLSLMLIDVDDFKRYNDTHGHPAGDNALRVVGGTLASTVRRTDRAYRHGGDEFAILLPETPSARASRLGERVRDAVRHSKLQTGANVSVSVGVAGVSSRCEVKELFARADSALYDAKHHGRNQVARAASGPPPDGAVTRRTPRSDAARARWPRRT